MKLLPCTQEEATHVRIIDEEPYSLTYGGIYAYHYDSHPSEETYYVITDEGDKFYDFECVTKVEYLKLVEDN